MGKKWATINCNWLKIRCHIWVCCWGLQLRAFTSLTLLSVVSLVHSIHFRWWNWKLTTKIRKQFFYSLEMFRQHNLVLQARKKGRIMCADLKIYAFNLHINIFSLRLSLRPGKIRNLRPFLSAQICIYGIFFFLFLIWMLWISNSNAIYIFALFLL